MAWYKLTIVKGNPCIDEEEICVIGKFETERQLVQWAEENQGVIDNA